MIYPNGQRVFCYPGRHMAGALAASGAMAYGGLEGARLNRFVSDVYSKVVGGLPSGYAGASAILPVKPGGISGASAFSLSTSAYGYMGRPGAGSASLVFGASNSARYPVDDASPLRTGSSSITFSVADAAGRLIASGAGSTSFAFAANSPLLVASLNGAGTALMAVSTNAPLLAANAELTASGSFAIAASNSMRYPLNDASPLRTVSASFSVTGSLVPFAIGLMSGSTAGAQAALTADAVASAVRAELSTELARIDTKVSSRASQADVFAAG